MGQRSQTVGGAGGIRDDVLVGGVLVVVDSIDISRSDLVSSWGRHYYLLGSTHQMGLALLLGKESTRAFGHHSYF